MRAFLRLLAVAGLLLLTAGPHVLAQSEGVVLYPKSTPGTKNPFSWLFGGRSEEKRTAAPARRTYEPRRRTAATPRPQQASPQPSGTVPQAEPGLPQVADATPAPPQISLNFLVIGDSLAGLLAQGLRDTYADRPGIVIHGKSRDSSGLVRDDYYDWGKAFRDILSGPEKFDGAIIMIGSNDRQALRDDQGAHEPRSDRWRELYAARIDAMIAIAKEKAVPLYWVGMPTMRSERYSGDLLAFNDIYRQRTQQAEVPFIDIWEAFGNEDGEYTVSGPDVSGEIVRLRTGDGVHFTKAGARKAAFFADKELQKIIATAQARLDVAAAQPPAISPLASQPRATDPLTLGPTTDQPAPLPRALRTIDSLLGIPMPDLAMRSALQPRPLAGPVAPLTAPARSEAGILAGPQMAIRTPQEAQAVFAEGRPQAAKPGRADDFSLRRSGQSITGP